MVQLPIDADRFVKRPRILGYECSGYPNHTSDDFQIASNSVASHIILSTVENCLEPLYHTRTGTIDESFDIDITNKQLVDNFTDENVTTFEENFVEIAENVPQIAVAEDNANEVPSVSNQLVQPQPVFSTIDAIIDEVASAKHSLNAEDRNEINQKSKRRKYQNVNTDTDSSISEEELQRRVQVYFFLTGLFYCGNLGTSIFCWFVVSLMG